MEFLSNKQLQISLNLKFRFKSFRKKHTECTHLMTNLRTIKHEVYILALLLHAK